MTAIFSGIFTLHVFPQDLAPVQVKLDETNIDITDPCTKILPIDGCGPGYAQTFYAGGTGHWNTVTTSACGYICPGIEQIYSFTAPTTGLYNIDITTGTGSYIDYMWKAASDGCSESGWACIDRVCGTSTSGPMLWTSGITYYILLDDEDINSGIHTFHISCPVICKTCPEYDYELTPTTTWQTHSSSLSYANECKIYRIFVGAHENYHFKTGCGNGATADFDTQLWIFFADCSLLNYNDDGCEDYRSHVSTKPVQPANRYVKVGGWEGDHGNYTLAYRICDEPLMPGTVSGPDNICEGTTHTYSVSPAAGATSYVWNLPPGWSGSSATTSIDATAGSAGGTIEVYGVNDCAPGNARTRHISVIPIPAQPGSITGATPVCEGANRPYNIAAVPGATDYTWGLPPGWSGSSTTPTIYGTAGSSGNMWVTANNSCGDSPKRYKAMVVIPSMAQPGAISGPSTVAHGSVNGYSISPVAGATTYT